MSRCLAQHRDQFVKLQRDLHAGLVREDRSYRFCPLQSETLLGHQPSQGGTGCKSGMMVALATGLSHSSLAVTWFLTMRMLLAVASRRGLWSQNTFWRCPDTIFLSDNRWFAPAVSKAQRLTVWSGSGRSLRRHVSEGYTSVWF